MAAMDLHTYDNTLYEKVYQTAYQAAAELIETAGMKAGQILVVGCSTSEVGGEKIGTYQSGAGGKGLWRNLCGCAGKRHLSGGPVLRAFKPCTDFRDRSGRKVWL